MPKYIMPISDTSVWDELPAFVQGYVEAALFCGVERAENDPLKDSDRDYDKAFDDLDAATLLTMCRDCEAFQQESTVQPLLAAAYARGDYDPRDAGRDFWYTRNHHGVGYWDRALGDLGDALTAETHKFREYDLFTADNGTVYGM